MTRPNTGGMGAYAPTPLVDRSMLKQIESEIVIPTLAAMKVEKSPYRGLLYCGIIATPEGPEGSGIQLPVRRSGNPVRSPSCAM